MILLRIRLVAWFCVSFSFVFFGSDLEILGLMGFGFGFCGGSLEFTRRRSWIISRGAIRLLRPCLDGTSLSSEFLSL